MMSQFHTFDQIASILNSWHVVKHNGSNGACEWCIAEFGEQAGDYYPDFYSEGGVKFELYHWSVIGGYLFDMEAAWEEVQVHGIDRGLSEIFLFKNECDAILFKLRWG